MRACAEALEARWLLTRLAVFGDYSSDSAIEPTRDVSLLVKSWNPDGVLTVGDNNYPVGSASTIDSNIGQWYSDFIYPYVGSYGSGSPTGTNRFWPALGNHDWDGPAGAQPYIDYFTLPHNERYYKVSIGDVDVFVIDSDPREPDGVTPDSAQATWIRQQMLESTARWKLVTAHHSPYTSGGHQSALNMQWPFKEWGADAVLTGHDHVYERLTQNGMPYFISGLGGKSIVNFATPITGSNVRYNGDYGALRVDTTDTTMTFQFFNRGGTLIDTYVINRALTPPTRALIPAWRTWTYLDNGSNQGTAWRNLGFDDSSWSSGRSEFGYGDGDEETVVSFGPNSNSKFITPYFRKTFNIADPANVTSLLLNLVRDDGAVVYLNGTEVLRNNMPGGTITNTTLASSTVNGSEESAWVLSGINPALLLAGQNVLAVEMHQISGTSTDLSFNLELTAHLTSETVPAAPSALAATAISATQINLTWADNASNENQFRVERSTDGVNFAPIDVVAIDETTYSDMNAIAGTTFYYRVQAINATHASGYSNIASATTASQVTLIPTGDVWKYLDNGSNQGTAWRNLGFDDLSWSSGAAPLGYGGDGEATTVSFGPNANSKFITTYFRRTINIADPSSLSALVMRIRRDDGAVVYLNGTEVFRTNMPAGTITHTTPASSAVEETTYYSASVDQSLLVAGNNVVAVEIHQSSGSSSDIFFDFELKATTTVPQPFAWMSGSTLNVDFDGTATPITLTGSGGNVIASKGPVALTFSGVISISGNGTSGSDILQINGPLPATLSFAAQTGNDTVRVLSGTHTFTSNLSPALANIAVIVDAGAAVTFDASQSIANLTVDGVATLSSAGGKTIETSNVGGVGKLDLRDGTLIRRYTGSSPIGSWNGSNYTGITGLIRAGRNGGSWNGDGLVTTMPPAILPSMLTTLAVSQDASSVIVKYTYAGDANLDQVIDGDDFFAIDTGFMSAATGYRNGDFDYNGRIDADDYFLIDSNYNKAQTPPAPSVGGVEWPNTGAFAAGDGSSVYELLLQPDENDLQ